MHNRDEKYFHKAKWDETVALYANFPQRLNFLTLVNRNLCCRPYSWVYLVFESLWLRKIDP